MQKPVGAFVFVILLLLAGCTGSIDMAGPELRGSATASPTVNRTTTDPATSITGPDSSTVSPSRVVEFHELKSQQQSAFRNALRDEASFVPNTSYVAESEGYDFEQLTPFQNHEYVRYEGELYRIRLGKGELYASYSIEASVGSPSDDETVITFDNLPEDIQDEMRTAIRKGEYDAPLGKWDSLPEPLRGTDYVRCENQTYKMSYTVGDAWAEVLTVEKVK